ncbi:di-heme oxidoreductase family protein [Rhizobium sp. C4]|uniref:di-heme oxidoreductase family protein n=1 Tax=Rhizobium sp. C4 TaxID=1349800 RepID=UPI001E2ADFDC|nr:di-heme oxidoredictase family protein [Rhizobium sp. C4]MCD2175418.1 c-type cytochrome [Rhizobium sp. C4]
MSKTASSKAVRPPRLRLWTSATALCFAAGAVGLCAIGIPGARAAESGYSEADAERVRAVTAPTADFSRPEAHETLSGGAGTFAGRSDAKAMSHPDATLDDKGVENFRLGFALFKKMWVQAPSSTQASDGLGPLFNARSCQSCHVRDGRGRPPEGGAGSQSFLFRLARTPASDTERAALAAHEHLNFPDPIYGQQLQEQGVTGLKGEGRPVITYGEKAVTLAGGDTVTLRVPTYSVVDLAYGPLDPATTLSPRIAQSLAGMGLLEAIPEAQILAGADRQAKSNDGVHGRPNHVRDPKTDEILIGRFGWKAQNPTVRAQAAAALSSDIGISSPDAPDPYGDCTQAEAACRKMPNGVQKRFGDTEAPDPVLDLLTAYTANLAVPARRDVDQPDVLAGKALFHQAGCATCHTPKFVTARKTAEPQHAFQLIWPYSDLLLHDMGADLADGQQVGDATGREWRTAPLWGIGLAQTVNGYQAYLHDGRARTLEEAILWHGGEGEGARNAYAAMQRADRQKLLKFLGSL